MLYTVKGMAEAIGHPERQVRRWIERLGIRPMERGRPSWYGLKQANAVKAAIAAKRSGVKPGRAKRRKGGGK